MKYISIRQQQNISYYGIFDNSLAQYIINIQLMFRRTSEMYISSTIASRSISAAEDLPGNFFVSKNRYFMVNHQYFGGVEKKFVIHRASPRDMRTKRELGGGGGGGNVEITEGDWRSFFRKRSLLANLLSVRAVIGIRKSVMKEKKREEVVFFETFVLINRNRMINCNLSQKERRPKCADTIIDL